MAALSVREACGACFEKHKGDCGGFGRAVADKLKVSLQGLANEIAETLCADQGWRPLPDGVVAALSAKDGKLVIGGLKRSRQTHPDLHGHVGAVVEGPLARNAYPSAYWEKLGEVGANDKTINYAWIAEDRDRVSYAERHI